MILDETGPPCRRRALQPADTPPAAARWSEFCDAESGQQTPVQVRIDAPLSAANCAALAASAVAQPGCGGSPVARSFACAWWWRDLHARCNTQGNHATLEAAAPGVTAACAAISAAAIVFEEMATVQPRRVHDFAFQAISGTMWRSPREGSGKSPLCTANALDSPDGEGPGSCAKYIAAGYSCAADYCADCPNAHLCDLSCRLRCPEDKPQIIARPACTATAG